MRFEISYGNGLPDGPNSVRFCLTVWDMACMPVCPAKAQSSLGIWPIWSVFAILFMGSLGSGGQWKTGGMPRLIWVFTGCKCHFVCFVMLQLIFKNYRASLRHERVWKIYKGSQGQKIQHEKFRMYFLTSNEKFRTFYIQKRLNTKCELK